MSSYLTGMSSYCFATSPSDWAGSSPFDHRCSSSPGRSCCHLWASCFHLRHLLLRQAGCSSSQGSWDCDLWEMVQTVASYLNPEGVAPSSSDKTLKCTAGGPPLSVGNWGPCLCSAGWMGNSPTSAAAAAVAAGRADCYHLHHYCCYYLLLQAFLHHRY